MDSWFFLSLPRYIDFCGCAVRKRRRTQQGKILRLIQDRLSDVESGRNLSCASSPIAASADRRFEFQKLCQLFIGTHNKKAFRRGGGSTTKMSRPCESMLWVRIAAGYEFQHFTSLTLKRDVPELGLRLISLAQLVRYCTMCQCSFERALGFKVIYFPSKYAAQVPFRLARRPDW